MVKYKIIYENIKSVSIIAYYAITSRGSGEFCQMSYTHRDAYSAVKARLEELLYEKRLSIHKLAMASGVPPSTIKNVLYGKSKNPGIVTIKMLCDGMGVSLAGFFGTEEFSVPGSEP